MPLFISIFCNFAPKYTLFIYMAQKNKNNFDNSKHRAQQKPSFATPAPTKEKGGKKPSVISKKESIIGIIIALLVFVALAVYELVNNNSDMLYFVQSRSFFLNDCTFLSELMRAPGYIGAWLGEYLTQYFYNPAVGSSILIALWIVLFFITKKAFRINKSWAFIALIPVACLLVSIIDNGYWTYYIKHPGYYFRETIGLIFTMTGVLIGSRLSGKTILQNVFIVVFAFLGYLFFGWYASLAIIYLIINEWVHSSSNMISKAVLTVVGMACTVVIPLISYNYIFTDIRVEDAMYAGFPRFLQDENESIHCETPFYIMAIVPFFFPLIARLTKGVMIGYKAHLTRLVYILVVIFAIPYVVDSCNFDNYNYHAEMRMYRATDENRWDDVLKESANYQTPPTREMVILNHIALFNKGTMGDQLFKYNNLSEAPYSFDSLRIHMVQTAGPLLYYHHAKTNFANRWCIENAVEYGYNFDEMKILVRCALVSGEWDVAERYLNILNKTMNYKDWAQNYLPIISNHELIKEHHEFDNIIELYSHMGSVLDGDNGLCEMYLLNYFANTMNKDSKLLQELTLNYALIQKDIQLFWPRFFLYAQLHPGQEMPTHYQEAAYLYGNLEHQVDITHMPFSPEIPQRYASFQQVSQTYLQQGMSTEQVAQAMKPEFGGTFWWFYFFCRDVKSY